MIRLDDTSFDNRKVDTRIRYKVSRLRKTLTSNNYTISASLDFRTSGKNGAQQNGES